VASEVWGKQGQALFHGKGNMGYFWIHLRGKEISLLLMRTRGKNFCKTMKCRSNNENAKF